MSEPAGTVFIVDDDMAVRDSTALYLSLRGFQTRLFASGEDFLAALDGQTAGCVLLDLLMPGLSGQEVYGQLQARRGDLPVVIMSGHGDIATVRQTLKAGASDYLEKPLNHELLIEAIEKAVAQHRQRMAEQRHQLRLRSCLERLTPREQEVLQLLARGLSNRDIAAALAISPRTVEVHKARVMDKLEARSLADLIRLGMQLGIS